MKKKYIFRVLRNDGSIYHESLYNSVLVAFDCVKAAQHFRIGGEASVFQICEIKEKVIFEDDPCQMMLPLGN